MRKSQVSDTRGEWPGWSVGCVWVNGVCSWPGAGAGKGLSSSPELAESAGRRDFFCCNEVYWSCANSLLNSVSGRHCCAVCRLSAVLMPCCSRVHFSSRCHCIYLNFPSPSLFPAQFHTNPSCFRIAVATLTFPLRPIPVGFPAPIP